jgi:serine/threonine protein kinase/formylglycine-generating enzyme required for sulfatase activity
MTSPPDPTVVLPQLPEGLLDDLLGILFGNPQARQGALAQLRAREPQHAAAIDAHVQHHELLRATEVRTDDAASIPGYRILETLGEGGMGLVYLAEQIVPVTRRVALKVIKLGMDSKEVVARFERERQSLAVMDHDAIARVFDCGTTSRGQPFFAMEYVQGEPIDAFADRHRLGLRERIALFQQVCHGVQHAHQKGVIHRDLKPGNVLVGQRDGQRTVKVIDFGVARATAPEARDAGLRTELGQLVGTPEYMSPEQALGEAARVDTRTDVFSLGVMLYELVSGALPYPPGHLRSSTLEVLRQRLGDQEPPRPSTRLHGLGAEAAQCALRRRLTLTSLQRELRGDLDWIVLRAMAREPERRYASVNALADDLQRYLDGLPVLAGPPSAGYRLRKFLRRYRGRLLAAGGILVALVGGLVGTGLALWEARASQRRVEMLANVVKVKAARIVAGDLSLQPAWPEQIPALDAWLRDFVTPLDEGVQKVRATLQSIGDGEVVPGLSSSTNQFLREELQGFLVDVDRLRANEAKDVAQRLRYAKSIEGLTRNHPKARVTWVAAHDAIAKADGITASTLYAAAPIDLQPQLDLVPMGMNPVTKMWEFYHLRSAIDPTAAGDAATVAIPEIAPDGSVVVGEGTGIVFVLVPGGTYTLFAQKTDPTKPNYDPDTVEGARTVDVTLAPFFLARHELTQGQWLRLAGSPSPSSHAAGTHPQGMDAPITFAHPVDMVDWFQCDALLRRHGLLLPTEAQWECGARGGNDAPWAHGPKVEDLRGAANLLDQCTEPAPWIGVRVAWNDRYIWHAPVGSFPKFNGFGLYDVHGNVCEWCRDGCNSPTPTWAPGDGAMSGPGSDDLRAFRGGSFLNPAIQARVSWREPYLPNFRFHDRGCRAARALR